MSDWSFHIFIQTKIIIQAPLISHSINYNLIKIKPLNSFPRHVKLKLINLYKKNNKNKSIY
jgi:hypothetical protein